MWEGHTQVTRTPVFLRFFISRERASAKERAALLDAA